jgi:uncharacterized protein (TIGR03382 family)
MALPFAAIAVGHAGIVTYSDLGSWQAALSSEVNSYGSDLAGTGLVRSGQVGIYNAIDIGQAGFVPLSGSLLVVDRLFSSPRFLDCDVACLEDGNQTNGSIRVVMFAPITAFAFDDFWPNQGSASLSVSIGSFTDNATQLSEQPSFLGFISTTPFTIITISSDQTPNIYDIAYGTTTVPEPGGATLIALGLLCVMSAVGRRRSALR